MKNFHLNPARATAVLAALWSFTALGASSATTTETATSVTDASAAVPAKKPLPIHVSTLSFLYGPPVNDPTSKSTADDSQDAITGLNTRHQLGISYAINKEMSIGPVFDFNYQLTDPNKQGQARRQFRWKDSFIKLSHSSLLDQNISGHQFSMPADFRVFVPSSKLARDNNTLGSVRLSLDPSIQFAKSAFSISTVNYIRRWFQQNSNEALPVTELYTGPQVNYAINSSLNAFVLYEAQVMYNQGRIASTDVKGQSNTDLEPGMDIKVHDRVTISPFLNWYVNQPLSTTSMNVSAAITLL